MSKKKILIVDNHKVVVEGIMSALRDYPEFEVVGSASDGEDAVEKAKELAPDIVIMDIAMPKSNGIEATRKIKSLNQGVGIIIFSMYANKEFVVDLFEEGISAYVLKDDPMVDLIAAIESVGRGGTYFSSMAPTILINTIRELESSDTEGGSLERLSHREREVFIHLAEGKSVKEIAEELFISPKTVESHKYNIMEKLDISRTVELTKLAIRKNLIEV